MKKYTILALIILILFLTGCTAQNTIPQPVIIVTPNPTKTLEPVPSPKPKYILKPGKEYVAGQDFPVGWYEFSGLDSMYMRYNNSTIMYISNNSFLRNTEQSIKANNPSVYELHRRNENYKYLTDGLFLRVDEDWKDVTIEYQGLFLK